MPRSIHTDGSNIVETFFRQQSPAEYEFARHSYRRYLEVIAEWNRNAQGAPGDVSAAAPKRPLEPCFLKVADRFVEAHIGEEITVAQLARHCGISERTLEKAFVDFRRITPVASIRNIRLDHARRALDCENARVGEVSLRFGFRSPTTFALEFRKRFGMAPSRSRRAANTT